MKSNESFNWFVRLYAGAVIAHVVGNPPLGLGPRGVVTFLLGGVASLAITRPESRRLRLAMAALVLASVWVEAPFIGNHWIVAGFTALAILASSLSSDWWGSFAVTGRGVLLAFYSFAAFAKLNTGFFDSTESCALFYTNQSLASWRVPQLQTGGMGALVIAVATVVIEASVPLLLISRRFRQYGVMLGFVFHFLISLDLHQHFYDFTALLFALFTLFVSDELTARWEAGIRRRGLLTTAVAVVGVILTTASVVPDSPATRWITTVGAFIAWIPIGGVLVIGVLRDVRWDAGVPRLRPVGVAGTLILAFVVLNGLTPYLGLKTAYGFNMYANLHTMDGESNHLLVRKTAALIDVPLVEIIASTDPALAVYIDSDYLVPERNVRHHLSSHPEATVTYLAEDGTVTGSGRELGRALPLLVEKFGLFRSVDARRPPRCQAVWLPAF